MDVVAAFLNPDIDETIFVRLPPVREDDGEAEWDIPWLDRERRIVMFRKALYGLRRSPRLWWLHIHNFLLSIGFTQSAHESNLYTKRGHIAILLYVDDLLIAYNDTEVARDVKLQLSHQIQDEGHGRSQAGLWVSRSPESLAKALYCRKKAYIQEVVRRFGLDNDRDDDIPRKPRYGSGPRRTKKRTRTYHTPMDLTVEVYDRPIEDIRQYQSIIGSINVRGTRNSPRCCLRRYRTREVRGSTPPDAPHGRRSPAAVSQNNVGSGPSLPAAKSTNP